MSNQVKIGFDSSDVIDALRRHHPAYNGPSGMQWVTLTEWCRIDLLALECWYQARAIGYEVKVSRGNMRSELLDPSKRTEAVRRTTHFYFAVPAGLLTADEIAFEEPDDWTFEDFDRPRCTNPDCQAKGRIGGRGFMRRRVSSRSSSLKGSDSEGASIYLGSGRESGRHPNGASYTITYKRMACCVLCQGYGTTAKSRVELEAPTLWIPRDCGLVEVDARGIRVVKLAPARKAPKLVDGREASDNETTNRLARQGVAQLVRHASAYQDPRHKGHQR